MLFIASAPATASVSGFIFPPPIYVCIPLWIGQRVIYPEYKFH